MRILRRLFRSEEPQEPISPELVEENGGRRGDEVSSADLSENDCW